MSRAVDLSTGALNRRALLRECEPAVGRLKQRANWLEVKATTLVVGSNARRDAEAKVKHLRACAALLESDTEYGDRIRRALQTANAVDSGWESLAKGVTILARKFRFEFDAEAEAQRDPHLAGIRVGEEYAQAEVDMKRRLTEKYGRPGQ